MAELDGSLGLCNRPVWFPSAAASGADNRSPFLSSQCQAKYPPVKPTPPPFGDFGRNGPLISGRVSESRYLAREQAQAGLSRCQGLSVRRRPALGPSVMWGGPGPRERA